MVSVLLSRLVILTVGTIYPAYRSYKAVRTKDVREYVKWMMYWIVFAVFSLIETVSDILVAFWFPFYYELKIVFVLWLLSPWTKGRSILPRKWIHPTLAKHERDIDALLEQAKNESYRQVVRLGSQSLLVARDLVATAALRGQTQLALQLQRSVSMNDVHQQEVWNEENGVGQARSITLTEQEEEEDDDFNTVDCQDASLSAVPRRSTRVRSEHSGGPGSEPMYATLPRRTRRQ